MITKATESNMIMTPKEMSEKFFGGGKSTWAILTAARKGQIPHFRIGRRVYFEADAIKQWAMRQSLLSVDKKKPEDKNGIRALK